MVQSLGISGLENKSNGMDKSHAVALINLWSFLRFPQVLLHAITVLEL